MKFDLAPDNRSQPDDVLLEDLRSVSARLGVRKLTREAYSAAGRFSPATIASRFGGWGRALQAGGLAPSRYFAVTKQECIDDLRQVATMLGVKTLTVVEYRRRGRFSEKPFNRHFGNWVSALNAAGLEVSEQFHPRSTDEDLFDNLEVVWQRLGRQPTVNDLFPPLSRFSAHVYKRRFGGFRKALEAFVSAAQQRESAPSTTLGDSAPHHVDGAEADRSVDRPVGNRAVGWRLRYLVLKRDRFSCRACGRSPAREPGTVLEVDHVIPWSRGGVTREANLQTLCERCNGGKGAG